MFAVNIPQSLLIGGNSGPNPTASSIIYTGETENNGRWFCQAEDIYTQMEIQVHPDSQHSP